MFRRMHATKSDEMSVISCRYRSLCFCRRYVCKNDGIPVTGFHRYPKIEPLIDSNIDPEEVLFPFPTSLLFSESLPWKFNFIGENLLKRTKN